MNDWDKILDDFAHKCGDGGPDMTNPRHLALLRESLIKFGWKENATNAFIGNLREGKEVIFEKRKPGEVWQTQSGWSGLKPGEKSAVYGMKSKEVAQASVTDHLPYQHLDHSHKPEQLLYFSFHILQIFHLVLILTIHFEFATLHLVFFSQILLLYLLSNYQ
jgi:hypothetical protein